MSVNPQLLVISSYPEVGVVHSAHTVGVASYTKNLLQAISKQHPELTIQVLAEKLPGVTPNQCREGQISICRVWERGNNAGWRSLLNDCCQSPATTILLSLEINMFGDKIHTWQALKTLAKIKKRAPQKKVITILHQVMCDFADLGEPPLKAALLNYGARYFYRLVANCSHQLIVFEQALKNNLPLSLPIEFIPHYISSEPVMLQTTAREKLSLQNNIIYALYFGYLAPYKGILPLVKNWPQPAPQVEQQQVQLIVAGGANPNHQKQKKLQQYVANTKKIAREKNLITTGFVSDEQLPLYLSACDLMIFPYQTFMSSSGPLALSFSYGKPCLLSEPLRTYAQSSDFAQNLAECQLTIDDLLFNPHESESIDKGLLKTLQQKKQRIKFASLMMKSRQLSVVAEKTYQLLFPEN